MQTTYRQAGRRKKRLRRRTSPAKQILKIVIIAAICVIAAYLTLVFALGFTATTRSFPTDDGKSITISYVGFIKDGVATSGSVTTSRGERGTVSQNKIIYSDGALYEGELDGFVRHGKGKLTFANGDIYEGEFISDEINGHGKFIYYSTGDVYEGEISGGKKVGIGK